MQRQTLLASSTLIKDVIDKRRAEERKLNKPLYRSTIKVSAQRACSVLKRQTKCPEKLVGQFGTIQPDQLPSLDSEVR